MNYISITSPDINNGTGCRVTLWIAGCTHNCPGCHNPETHSYKAGKVFDEEAEKILFEKLSKPYIKGLTVSGGDPLDQIPEFLTQLRDVLKRVHEKFLEKDVWMYTGFEYEELDHNQLDVLQYVDILVDGPFKQKLRDVTLPFRGSSNQRIINLKDLRK